MPNLTNPVTDVARFAMKTSSRKISLAGEQIATGKRGPSDIVDYVIGSKLRDNTTVLSSVAKGINYGTQMLKNTQSVLESVKKELTAAKGIIADAGPLNGEQLINVNNLYLQTIRNVQRLLQREGVYDGRNLFDGSLAGPGGNAAQAIPAGASPLNIRVGEDINNVISIAIARLLPGNGAAADVAVPGVFTPVLPITLAGVAAKTNAVAQLIAIFGAVPNVAGVANAAAAEGAIRVLPAPGNAEGDAVLAAAKAAAAAALPATADAVGANAILNASMNAALNVAAAYIAPEAVDAIRTILNAATAGGLANANTSAQYQAVIQALPLPSNAIGNAIINAAKVGAVGGGAGTFIDQKHATFVAAITQALVGANSIVSAGDVLTQGHRNTADAYITNALNTVISAIASKGGDLQNVVGAGDDVNSSIKVQSEAADSYLNTNYEEASRDFKNALLAMRGSISITTQGYRVAEAALNLIEG